MYQIQSKQPLSTTFPFRLEDRQKSPPMADKAVAFTAHKITAKEYNKHRSKPLTANVPIYSYCSCI